MGGPPQIHSWVNDIFLKPWRTIGVASMEVQGVGSLPSQIHFLLYIVLCWLDFFKYMFRRFGSARISPVAPGGCVLAFSLASYARCAIAAPTFRLVFDFALIWSLRNPGGTGRLEGIGPGRGVLSDPFFGLPAAGLL